MEATIKNQTFGFEMEYYGLTRKASAILIAEYLGGRAYNELGRKWVATDSRGRKWRVVYDASILAPRGEKCELVTPILNYDDIETLQEIVRILRHAGAGVNDSCGIHIHIGADKHSARSLKNLSNIFYSKQDMMFRALNIHPSRAAKWCKPLETSYIENLKNAKPKSINDIGRVWYGCDPVRRQSKYDRSRYSGLNLHSVFFTGTVEFRCFNSTTHAGRVKAYIQFVLAVSAQAINSRSARSAVTQTTNDKFTFRGWLLRLELIGDEFKTCRHHMLANLEGDGSNRYAV